MCIFLFYLTPLSHEMAMVTKAQKIRWRVDKEFQKFEGLQLFVGLHKEFALIFSTAPSEYYIATVAAERCSPLLGTLVFRARWKAHFEYAFSFMSYMHYV
jgi:hypothetical protein